MFPYISVFGTTIGAYGLMMTIGVLLSGMFALRAARRLRIAAEDILILGASSIAFALLGGKLLYIFVSYPISQILDAILIGDWALFVGGGIVFYGGLLGGVAGAIIGSRISGLSICRAEYAIVPYIPLGHAVGRVGCLLAGCCYGFEYDGPLAVYYPHSLTGLSPEQGYFPTQLVEALWNLIVAAALHFFAKRKRNPYGILTAYLFLYAVGRFVLEWFRGDAYRGIWWGLSLSQWISIGLMCGCTISHCSMRQRKK